MMNYFVRHRLLPCNKILYRPERTEQLADPSWWHAYMQPLHCQPPMSPSTSQTNPIIQQKQKIRFQEAGHGSEDEESENPKELPVITSNSQRCLPVQSTRKISPTDGIEPNPRQNRLFGRMRRELSFEETSVRNRLMSSSKRSTAEFSSSSDASHGLKEDALMRRRNQSFRGRGEAPFQGNFPQRPASQPHEDSSRKKQTHFLP